MPHAVFCAHLSCFCVQPLMCLYWAPLPYARDAVDKLQQATCEQNSRSGFLVLYLVILLNNGIDVLFVSRSWFQVKKYATYVIGVF